MSAITTLQKTKRCFVCSRPFLPYAGLRQ